MKKLVLALLSLQSITVSAQQLVKYVDPFLGTGGHGHVYPGATVPFGMVQLSPDNGDEGWDWCSGYHYSSNTIAGFSHTHLSGTGIGDWYDISVLPLTDTNEIRKEKIKIPFLHGNEKAKPGYYAVLLNNNIQCELTTEDRTGYHRYTFPETNGWLRFDMGFRLNWDQSTAGMLQLVNETTLIGYRYSTGWAKGQKVYFAARFSSPVQNYFFIDDSVTVGNKADGKLVKAALQFNTASPLLVKVSLSSVSTEKALLELSKTKTQTFEAVHNKAEQLWEKELQKIKINTNDKEPATKFYLSNA
jgi:predicted alpha-1,2-mannosidase